MKDLGRRGTAVLIAVTVAVAAAGCGAAARSDGGGGGGGGGGQRNANGGGAALHGHPQAIDPVAGEAAQIGATEDGSAAGTAPATAGVSVNSPGSAALQQPISNTEVEVDLRESGISANVNVASLTPGGLAIAPANAPPAVQAVINAANEIARLPYIWGGGHATYEDTGYDCSGSLSFILAAAGLLNGTETSGEFMSYGDPGPGKWMTIYAMNGHTFAYIAGLRFDTVALAETGSRWSNRPADEPNLSSFVARHPPGL